MLTSAHEAHIASNSHRDIKADRDIVKKYIDEAIQKGEFGTKIPYTELNNAIIMVLELEKLGYHCCRQVTAHGECSEFALYVSWSNDN